ncbi:UDP-N-acetylmuramoyl-tripeptide--D-alanyl-D-alanine ligase [Lysobacter antibioticus]|uniref:UDP-N-acetylmuramoyl-tripeptide--D-alanyl-D-alanine ligase n=1 Tax=Lysobacter antibioticus TaxID=84531 RepID=A0A0S2F785_LYSAN|nr:UDP-N-acetylmuramoyl-tripeptide--D-alanyl-D-alanine ligase [Lysobacter antibioticus]ALN79329.1 UDP-N-acetylmuramoylalanyl-D-glutamyl-2, 6-diaminopimelate--D-alanyl-D-alanine ligase [Lysobacter antibioticus]
MKSLLLSEIARMTGGRLRGADAAIDLVVTDTRALPETGAALFVALKGERFDGHDHVAKLAGSAVVGALVAREIDARVAQVVVADSERALADLAAAVQAQRSGSTVVAITGSNGKTSVKTLTAAILERAGRTYATPGNRNNEIGLPLAVLDAPEDAQFAIYEMGAGKPGDIAYLVRVARPQVALVNNIAPAHLERMGSLLGIADTKAAIYDALPADGVAVINADDAFAPYFGERAAGRRVIRFGLDASAEVTAHDVRLGTEGSTFVLVAPQGRAEIALQLVGRHNVRNALAAASLALAAGAGFDAVVAGLNAARPVEGRLITHRLDNGAVLIDDSYNANPGSTAAAIDALAEIGGENWLVLGDMREIGNDEIAMHVEIGRRAKASGIRRLYALGALSSAAAQAFGEGGSVHESHAALAQTLAADLRDGVRVLVKGSHSSAMDRIVTALLSAQKPEQGKGTSHVA